MGKKCGTKGKADKDKNGTKKIKYSAPYSLHTMLKCE
jgi:hypothetical protein